MTLSTAKRYVLVRRMVDDPHGTFLIVSATIECAKKEYEAIRKLLVEMGKIEAISRLSCTSVEEEKDEPK